MTVTSDSTPPDGTGFDALIFDWDGTLADSRQVCFDGLARALADVGVVLDPAWYWPREAIASPDMLVLWEREFGRLPEPIDEIIVRCRRHVMAAASSLVVVDALVQIARAARRRGQRLAIGSNSSTNVVAAGLAATSLGGLSTRLSHGVMWRKAGGSQRRTSSCSLLGVSMCGRSGAWCTKTPMLVLLRPWPPG